jgi:hypothetical protein
MVVIGGGYVGLEQAQLWAHLGVQVTVVGRFAPHTKPEIAGVLRGVFADDGISVVEERAAAVEPNGDGVLVRTASGLEVTGERLLVATGRHADTGDLGLGAAGIDTDERGFVVVDAHQRTSNPRGVRRRRRLRGAAVRLRGGADGSRRRRRRARPAEHRRLPGPARRHVHHPAARQRGDDRSAGPGRRALLRLPRSRRPGHPPRAGQRRHPRRAQARHRRPARSSASTPHSTAPGT